MRIILLHKKGNNSLVYHIQESFYEEGKNEDEISGPWILSENLLFDFFIRTRRIVLGGKRNNKRREFEYSRPRTARARTRLTQIPSRRVNDFYKRATCKYNAIVDGCKTYEWTAQWMNPTSNESSVGSARRWGSHGGQMMQDGATRMELTICNYNQQNIFFIFFFVCKWNNCFFT